MTEDRLIARRTTEARDLAPRPVDLDGQRLGVLDCGDEGSARFLDLLTVRLEKRHFLSAVVRVRKPDPDQASPAELLDQLAEQCDVVVTGICRSAPAAESTATDAGALERLSVPCAILVAAEVRSEAQQSMTAHGYAAGSIVELPRSPYADREVAQALVGESFRAVERVLTVGERFPKPVEPARPAQRNGEVSCEC